MSQNTSHHCTLVAVRGSYLLVAALAGCGFSVPAGGAPGDAPRSDAPRDAADAPVDMVVPLGPWGTPTPITEISGGGAEDDPTLTGDMLEVYFNLNGDIYGSTRASVTSPWPTPVPIAAVNSTTATETTCEVSPDGLELFFSSSRIGGAGGQDIYVSSRASRGLPFGAPVRLADLATSTDDVTPTTFTNGALVMYLSSLRAGSLDLYRSTRPTRTDPWSTPVLVSELQTSGTETEPTLTPSDTFMILSGDGPGGRDLFMTSRAAPSDPWDTPVPITELNTGTSEEDPWLSPDGRTLVFSSNRGGSYDLYITTR